MMSIEHRVLSIEEGCDALNGSHVKYALWGKSYPERVS